MVMCGCGKFQAQIARHSKVMDADQHVGCSWKMVKKINQSNYSSLALVSSNLGLLWFSFKLPFCLLIIDSELKTRFTFSLISPHLEQFVLLISSFSVEMCCVWHVWWPITKLFFCQPLDLKNNLTFSWWNTID